MLLKTVNINPSPLFYSVTLKLRPHSRPKLKSKDNIIFHLSRGAPEDSKATNLSYGLINISDVVA